MNHSCVSIMYISTNGAHRMKSTAKFGSPRVPQRRVGNHSRPRSSAHTSRVGATSGAIWYVREPKLEEAEGEPEGVEHELRGARDLLADEQPVERLRQVTALARRATAHRTRSPGRSARASTARAPCRSRQRSQTSATHTCRPLERVNPRWASIR